MFATNTNTTTLYVEFGNTGKYSRDGKRLKNSTGKTSSLKNQHTTYVHNMFKIVQKFAKMPKIAQRKTKKA